jgi:hypothetical protein
MESDGEHLLQDRDGRLDVNDAILGGPGPISRHIFLPFDRDGQVLMPDYLPVGVRRLVKQNGADGASIDPQDGLCCL